MEQLMNLFATSLSKPPVNYQSTIVAGDALTLIHFLETH
jgi:hypothetical protein